MQDKNIKIIAILGPTSSGKSDLGVDIAKQFGGEIISADSRQVYRGMDLGTGKITKKEMRGIRHHLLDVANPKNSSFNVSTFQQKANKLIGEIVSRNKVPLLVGGTGFWIDAVARSQSLPDVPPNPRLRKELSAKNPGELLSILKKLDSKRAKEIIAKNEVNNKHRLIRAIEIANGRGKSKKAEPLPSYDVLYIGLDIPTKILYGRIDKRLDARLKKGMAAEIQKLHKNGVSWKRLESFGLEYRFVSQYLQNKLNKEEMRELLSYAIKHYAKRQRTWFKRHKDILWFNPENKTSAKKISRLVKTFLES